MAARPTIVRRPAPSGRKERPIARVERRLAAILAADIVGYSRLMEQDEAGTLESMHRLREKVIDPAIAEHRGRIVKLIGDGILVEFASVVDAVACAVAIQVGVAEHETDQPAGRGIVFRIGVNLGDVVVQGDDLLGDGVNVAARLEQRCEPGGVLISGTAYDQLQGKLGLPVEFTGEQRVKNISRPVRTYRIRLAGTSPARRRWHLDRRAVAVALALLLVAATTGGAVWWWRKAPRSGGADPLTVAVLPFADRSPDRRLGRMGDEIASDLIDKLSIFRFASTLAGSATFPYGDRPDAAKALSRDFGADYVVEGALSTGAGRSRLDVHAVDARSGEQIWNDHYEQAQGELTIDDNVTGRIASSLMASGIQREIRKQALRKPVTALNAHELALLGQDQLSQRTKAANAKGLELIQRAIEIDPGFSAAWMWRAQLYNQQVDEGMAPVTEAMQHWREAAETAVSLDPSYAYAHLMLGAWAAYSGRWDLASAEFDRVLQLAPDSATVLRDVGWQLPWLGQTRRAVALVAQAGQLDPDLFLGAVRAQTGFFDHRFADTVQIVDDMENPDRWSLLIGTLGQAQLGDAEVTTEWRARFLQRWPDYSFELALSQGGAFAPAATAEKALWLDSLQKAGLPLCATAQQLGTRGIARLPECDAERAKATAAPATAG
ncbi:MAG: adenylate/guanylate cyclase domain-containing protein [Geminicoccaceae bacterium]